MADQSLTVQEKGWVEAIERSELNIAKLDEQPSEASGAGASFVRNSKNSRIQAEKTRLFGLWLELVYCRYLMADPDNKYNEKSGPVGRNFNYTGKAPSDNENSTILHTDDDFRLLRKMATETFKHPANSPDKRLAVDASAIGRDGKGRMQVNHLTVQNRIERDLKKTADADTPTIEIKSQATARRNEGFPYVVDLRGQEPPSADSTESIQAVLNDQPQASVHDLQPGQLTLSTGNLEHFAGQVSMKDKKRVWKTRMVPKTIYILKDPVTEDNDDDDDVGPVMQFSKRQNDDEETSNKRQAT